MRRVPHESYYCAIGPLIPTTRQIYILTMVRKQDGFAIMVAHQRNHYINFIDVITATGLN